MTTYVAVQTTGDRLDKLVSCVEGLSLRGLAELAGISPSYPALIVTGVRSKIGGDVAVKLARVLGTTSDYLLSGIGKPPGPETVKAAVEEARAQLGQERAAAEEASEDAAEEPAVDPLDVPLTESTADNTKPTLPSFDVVEGEDKESNDAA